MDPIKTGQLIRQLRTAQGLTQRALAAQLHVTDKTVSKWETGGGCPDISLMRPLCHVLSVSMETLLGGEITKQEDNGNMKKLRFYVCPGCGNILTAETEAQVHCCGRLLTPLTPRRAEEAECLQMEAADGEWYITSDHAMTKESYIAFVAFLTDSQLVLTRLYPEWGLHVRMPYFARGRLLWYCTDQGLLYREVFVKRQPEA